MALRTFNYDAVTVLCGGQQYQFEFREDDGANPIRNPSGSVLRQTWDAQGCVIVSTQVVQRQELDYSNPAAPAPALPPLNPTPAPAPTGGGIFAPLPVGTVAPAPLSPITPTWSFDEDFPTGGPFGTTQTPAASGQIGGSNGLRLLVIAGFVYWLFFR